ncbi:hypothetical protein SAY87_009768 [Trapa incisa]|uniref:Zinc-ribbon domain-containing protein n=1 Tax=Trapa incisa TaxID=236973 RepID=A0AAN7JY67_9MYRT|nr:hypothetical protein SAY87_009768 [Trapa incisa]
MTPEVHLVKCPKCRNLLPEPADVVVYKCGGCDTILQAKHWNKYGDTRTGLQEATGAPRDELVHGFVGDEKSTNFDRAVIHSSGEHSSGPKNMTGDMLMNDHLPKSHGTLDESSNSMEEGLQLPNGTSSLPEVVGKENIDEQTNGISMGSKDLEEVPEKSQMSVLHKHGLSDETIASREYADPPSEFSGTVIGDSPKYLPTTPDHHHAYDRSISSLGDSTDLFNNWDTSRGKQHHMKDEDTLGFSREIPHKNRFVKSKMAEMSRNGVRKSMIYGRNNDLPPKIPVHDRASRSMYKDEGFPYRRGLNVMQHSSRNCFSEEDTTKLLQIVYEIEKQLKKANLNQVDAQRGGRDAYYSHELPQDGGRADMNFPRHGPWARNFRPSKIPFSAETTRTAYRHYDSPWGHFPRPRHLSEPLLPPAFHDKSIHNTHTSKNVYGPYSSLPTSPQQYMGSEFSTESRYPSHELQKLRKYYTEKEDHLLRRHLRPAVGAAPFMTCYHCSEILHLLEESISNKNHHRVRCGACSAILKFSLESRSCFIPCKANARVVPPFKADHYDNSIRERYF